MFSRLFSFSRGVFKCFPLLDSIEKGSESLDELFIEATGYPFQTETLCQVYDNIRPYIGHIVGMETPDILL